MDKSAVESTIESTMTNNANPMERRLRLSGFLLILGLLTEAICLFWARPISFIVLIAVGGTLLLLGVVLYLLSLVSIRHSSDSGSL